jgi:tetratricopeptide (TPR) repeat protein
MFLYGLCATIHQTLLLSAMGIEVAIALASPRLGRDMFFCNSAIFVTSLMLMNTVPALQQMSTIEKELFYIVGIGSLAATFWLAMETKGLLTEWSAVILMGLAWVAGICAYFYEPLSCMTDPPMQWGYPRTVEGFFHALSRGQYESVHGSNIFADPGRFLFQLGYIVQGLSESFSWVYIFVGVLPFAYLMKMHKRERSWIIGLVAIYFCLSVLLVILIDVAPDRSSTDLNKVFFTASHGLFAMMIGYGLALIAAFTATHYEKVRRWGFVVGAAAAGLAVYMLVDETGKLYFGPAGGFPAEHAFIFGIIIAAGLAVIACLYFYCLRSVKSLNNPKLEAAYLWGLPGALFFLALIVRFAFPQFSADCFDSTVNFVRDFVRAPGEIIHSQVPHYVAQAFDRDQYGMPVFANLILLAIPLCLIGAFLVYRQRGPLLIMLAVFCIMPSWSYLSHWYKSEQHNHWFGFWFGHDMFTPPFTDPKTGQLTYDNELRANLLKNPANASIIYPEMDRNTILFGGTDPGRFCPTYSIFCDSFIPHDCQPKQDQKFDRRDCYLITQNALADGTYLEYLRAQYNRSRQVDPPFFSRLFRYVAGLLHVGSPDSVILEGPDMGAGDTGDALVEGICRLLDDTLDNWFTAWGAHVEKYRRARGVYPSAEIYIPSLEDSQACFQEYSEDAYRRKQNGQLAPGEIVNSENGRVQVSGNVAVMKINGLLCRVIFDHNPTNSFYVEESFPLDWMYPYETPFGIIMKINRNPLPELPDEVFKLDHEFWAKYSKRLCGDWITYDTTVQQIADFVDRTYIHNNYQGYTGDQAFVRDDDAQKAFSKLRSSQAGMYYWRMSGSCPPEYRQKTAAGQAALVRETEFAFKQAFAFCPYSPEAVYRYVNFLLQLAQSEETTGHPDKAIRYFDDGILVVKTCQKLDPFNASLGDLIKNIQTYKARDQQAGAPSGVQNLLAQANTLMQMKQTNRAVGLFDQALASPEITAQEAQAVAVAAAQMQDYTRLGTALRKMVDLEPDLPEPRCDLAALESITGHSSAALADLKLALDLSAKRRAQDPTAPDLAASVRDDPRFASIRNLPEFRKLIPPK